MGPGRVVVGEREIEVAVSVEIHPLDPVRRAMRQLQRRQDVNQAAAFVVKQEVVFLDRLIDVRRHVEVRAAVVVVVPPPRRRRFVAALHTKLCGDFRECSAAVIPIQEVGAIAGDEQVEIAVTVDVRNARAVAPGGLRPGSAVHAKLARHVHESRAVVAEHAVGVAVLVGDEEIEVAVFVEVEPHRTHGSARIVEAELPADARETTAVIPEQHVGRIAKRDEQIEVAVVVNVDPRDLTRFAQRVDAHGRADVREMRAAAVVPIEPVARLRSAGEPDVQVDLAVAIKIAPRRGASVGEVGDPGRARHLDECPAIVAIQPVRLALLEADEQIQIAVAVDVRPGVRLAAWRPEQLRLDQLELRCGRRERRDGQRHDQQSHDVTL